MLGAAHTYVLQRGLLEQLNAQSAADVRPFAGYGWIQSLLLPVTNVPP